MTYKQLVEQVEELRATHPMLSVNVEVSYWTHRTGGKELTWRLWWAESETARGQAITGVSAQYVYDLFRAQVEPDQATLDAVDPVPEAATASA